MLNKILVISAHPDDETLGCGATLLRHKNENRSLYWLIVTAMSRASGFTNTRMKRRTKEIDAVAKAYGFLDVFKLNFPTAGLDRVPVTKIIEGIRNAVNKIKAEVVYLPHEGDLHTDHQITHKAAIAGTRSFRTSSVRKILAYETVSETEFAPPHKRNAFIPNVFMDITEFMDDKIKIMKIYKSEIKRFPFPRSEKNLKALATFRGATIGVPYAEAFMLIRESIR